MTCGWPFLVTVKWSCSAAARSAISVNRFFASVIDMVSMAIILAINGVRANWLHHPVSELPAMRRMSSRSWACPKASASKGAAVTARGTGNLPAAVGE